MPRAKAKRDSIAAFRQERTRLWRESRSYGRVSLPHTTSGAGMSLISTSERDYLRELARRHLEYANLPIMQERMREWKRHNQGLPGRPMLVMEMGTFAGDMMPPMTCTSDLAREIEWILLQDQVNFQEINDDKVISPDYAMSWWISLNNWDGLAIPKQGGVDIEGRSLGYSEQHPFTDDLPNDLKKLRPSTFSVNRAGTLARKAQIEDILGDILPVKIKNTSMQWHCTPTAQIVSLMGMQNMFFAMMDHPDDMHRLAQFLIDDVLAYARWQEREGLLVANNDNDYVGAGSMGFTDELPTAASRAAGRVTLKDLWVNMNSQETVGVSPAMFLDFFYPIYEQAAREFGLVYYGCCEPVHEIWDVCLKNLPNLRKVSISAWCNEPFMGDRLRGGKIIYSRKPSPNYIGVGAIFDENAYRAHIAATLKAAQGCVLEIIHRDVYTLVGDKTKPGRAIQICRDLIGE